LISLNKAASLTQGNPIRLSNLVSSLAPDSHSPTVLMDDPEKEINWYGQVLHQPGDRSARLSFFTPDQFDPGKDPSALFEYLCFQAGEMGALNVLADVEETHPLHDILRAVGFNVYGWETIWRLPNHFGSSVPASSWSKSSPVDDPAIRSLYQTLVPPLVQNAEPFTNGNTPRLVYRPGSDIMAYVESLGGHQGIYLIPLIHPSVEDPGTLMIDLVNHFQDLGRPVYIQVRSYQAWLTEILEQLGAHSTPRFNLLVKHLAVGQYSTVKEAQRVRSDQRRAEPSSPMLNHYVKPQPRDEGLK